MTKLSLNSVDVALVNRFGIPVTFHFNVEHGNNPVDQPALQQQLLKAQCALTKLGYTSPQVPHGGFIFPFQAEEDFNWSLIGAVPFRMGDDDDQFVRFGDHVYKRRVLPANLNKNMPEIVKYSRGAKKTDLPHLVEGDDGVNYITLVSFRGNGPIDGLIKSA